MAAKSTAAKPKRQDPEDLTKKESERLDAVAEGRPEDAPASGGSKTGKSAREAHYKTLRDFQRENVERLVTHPATEFHHDIAVSSADGKSEKKLEVHVFDGVVYMNTHGEVRVTKDQLIDLRQKLDAAFQTIA